MRAGSEPSLNHMQDKQLTIRISRAALLLVSVCGGGAVLFSVVMYHATRPSTIHEAARRGNTAVIRKLVQSHPQLLNSTDDLGHTPLNWAILNGRTEAVTILVDLGANVDSTDSKQFPPIICAASRVGLHARTSMRILIGSGANLDATAKPEGGTALHSCAWKRQERMVKMLVKAGANVNAVQNHDSGLKTPLDRACEMQQVLEYRKPHFEGATWGDPKLHRQRIERQERIVRFLQTHGGLRFRDLPKNAARKPSAEQGSAK